MIEYLDVADLLKIARHATGEEATVRDYGLLESAQSASARFGVRTGRLS